MKENKVELLEIKVTDIGKIKGLWEELNQHHYEVSTNFKEEYRNFKFDERMSLLKEKAKKSILKIDVVNDKNINKLVGYCISSIDENNNGEVESLYLKKEYRGHKIGENLMKRSLAWMDENQVTTKRIVVAAGNENVFSFYQKYGFQHKYDVMYNL